MVQPREGVHVLDVGAALHRPVSHAEGPPLTQVVAQLQRGVHRAAGAARQAVGIEGKAPVGEGSPLTGHVQQGHESEVVLPLLVEP